MHFIEVLLGISRFVFIFSIIPLAFLSIRGYKNLLIIMVVVSLVLIALCLVLYICNALMTCVNIWFSNW